VPNTSGLKEYSVSEFSQAIKRSVEGTFPFIRLRGEVSDLSFAPSGHIYFSLKEGRDTLSTVLWKSTSKRLSNQLNRFLEEGVEIIATGRITTFPGNSRYQLVVDDIELSGPGALIAQIEELRLQLQKEGIFSYQKEEAIPLIPEVIGVVTSPTGSVIRDILHRISERFPRQVIVWPVAVQGENCPLEVKSAIEGFNALPTDGIIPKPDVIIVARGGGSFADLIGFNDEQVVRATANSDIPIVSAVGHETDTTLIDYAANKRAPTPTAAAEFVVPVRSELESLIQREHHQISDTINNSIEAKEQRIRDLGRGLPASDTLFSLNHQELDNLSQRLQKSFTQNLNRYKSRLEICGTGLKSPKTLEESKYKFNYVLKRLTSRVLEHRINQSQLNTAKTGGKLNVAYVDCIETKANELNNLKRLLASLSYKQTLTRGYAIVRQEKQVVTHAHNLNYDKSVEVEMIDGEISLEIIHNSLDKNIE